MDINTQNEIIAKPWTAADRWYFGGNLLLSIGTLCLSIAHLVQLANNGRISDFTGQYATGSRNGPHVTTRHDDDLSASSYFRRG